MLYRVKRRKKSLACAVEMMTCATENSEKVPWVTTREKHFFTFSPLDGNMRKDPKALKCKPCYAFSTLSDETTFLLFE